MNDDDGAAVTEDGKVVAAQSHVGSDDTDTGSSIGSHDQGKVRNVSRQQPAAVFCVRAAEVGSRGLEIGRFALCDLVDMEGMLAWRKTVDVEFDPYAMRRLGKDSRSNAVSFGVLDVHSDRPGSGMSVGGWYGRSSQTNNPQTHQT
jgi:hypothetical protein